MTRSPSRARVPRRGPGGPARLGPVAVVALLLAFVPLVEAVAAPPAAAIDQGQGHPGFCTTSVGVTVVVDFQDLGGTTIVRCNPQATRGTGLDALKGAGFQIEGVQRWGEAFICRVENRPSAVETVAVAGDGGYRERCIDTPPASAYWSYWHAGNGCAWSYSQWGVKNRDFVPGGFEAWSFSLNATADANPEPRIAAVRPGTEGAACDAPDEPGPTTDDPDEQQSGVGPGGGGAGANGDGDGDGATAADPGSASSGAVAGGGEGSGSAEGPTARPAPRPRPLTTAPTAPEVGGEEQAADPADNVAFTGGADGEDVRDVVRRQSGASRAAPFVAVAIVVALAAGAGHTARRRRRLRDA